MSGFASAGRYEGPHFAALGNDFLCHAAYSDTARGFCSILRAMARGRNTTTLSDRAIADTIDRSVGTVQRRLREAEAEGLIERQRDHDNVANPTNRVIRFLQPLTAVLDYLRGRPKPSASTRSNSSASTRSKARDSSSVRKEEEKKNAPDGGSATLRAAAAGAEAEGNADTEADRAAGLAQLRAAVERPPRAAPEVSPRARIAAAGPRKALKLDERHSRAMDELRDHQARRAAPEPAESPPSGIVAALVKVFQRRKE